MKHICRILSALLALMLCMPGCMAEASDPAVALVNGEELLYSTYASIENAYLFQYESAGVDLTDPTNYAYVQDLALTYAIEQQLVVQDMRAQGCYELDAETEAWCVEQGKATYEQALAEVGDMMRETLGLVEESDVTEYALSYAASLNVTEETYIDVYRTQYAATKYQEWLIREQPVTEADVQSAYEARVEASKGLYGKDAAAFETAAVNGGEAWYRPAGYRSILQILLPAEGATEAEKLASVQETTDAIAARLAQGEAFESLIREFGTDPSFSDEAFFSTGYQVHRDSVLWEEAFVAAAFSAEMAEPGCWSKPFASDIGVHILYYLADTPEGPVALSEELYDALAYVIYTERTQAAQAARIEELTASAAIEIY